MKRLSLLGLAISFCFAGSGYGAVTTLTAGVNDTSDPLVQVFDWTIDIGFVVPALPASPNQILFESGGDGTGIAIGLIGSDLQVYQDQGAFDVSSPVGDTFFSVGVGAFSGQTVSLRLDANLMGAAGEDYLQLDVSNGSTLLTSGMVTSTVDLTIGSAGGNDTGLGIVAADLAGLDEAVEDGFPDMAQFNSADYKTGGANVLSGDRIAAILYTDEDPAGAIPAPSSWGLVPEPSSSLLILGGGLLFFRRRR